MAQVNGIVVWTEGIKAELAKRLPKQRKTQRDKLVVLVATMLHVRSANLSRLAWADQQIAVLNLSGMMICNAREPHGWQVAYRSGRGAAPSLGGAEPIA